MTRWAYIHFFSSPGQDYLLRYCILKNILNFNLPKLETNFYRSCVIYGIKIESLYHNAASWQLNNAWFCHACFVRLHTMSKSWGTPAVLDNSVTYWQVAKCIQNYYYCKIIHQIIRLACYKLHHLQSYSLFSTKKNKYI